MPRKNGTAGRILRTQPIGHRIVAVLLHFFTGFAVVAGLPALLAAQGPCYGFGSIPTPSNWQAGPMLQSCPFAPNHPAWWLYTPGHRAPAPHPGFHPGDAWPLPRVIVTYRCTGFLLVPIVPNRIRTMGYVIDQPELPC